VTNKLRKWPLVILPTCCKVEYTPANLAESYSTHIS